MECPEGWSKGLFSTLLASVTLSDSLKGSGSDSDTSESEAKGLGRGSGGFIYSEWLTPPPQMLRRPSPEGLLKNDMVQDPLEALRASGLAGNPAMVLGR